MQFEGTVTRLKDKLVAIVMVDAGVVDDPATAGEVLATYQHDVFGTTPIVLLGRDPAGAITRYFGPADIVAQLSNIDPRRFSWRRYTSKTKV